MKPFDKTEEYEATIRPMMQALALACEELGIPYLISVSPLVNEAGPGFAIAQGSRSEDGYMPPRFEMCLDILTDPDAPMTMGGVFDDILHRIFR